MRKPKLPSTTIKAVEKLFGPVLPGMNTPERTISVFQEYTSPQRYKLFGQLGIIHGALWHLHTQVPIVPSKIKGRITGILEGGNQHDPMRQQLAATWLSTHTAAKEAETAAAARKAAANEAKKQEADRKKEEALRSSEAKKTAAAEVKRQKELAASRAGEYDGQLSIGGTLNTILPVRVKVDAKGKVSLILPKGHGLRLPPGGRTAIQCP